MATLTILNPDDDDAGGGLPPRPGSPLAPARMPAPAPLAPMPRVSRALSAGGGGATPAPTGASASVPEGGSPVSAFDRPVSVIILGPRPLDVNIVGGMPASESPRIDPMPKPKAEDGWGKWVADLAGTGVRRTGVAAAGAANGSVMPALGTAVEGAVSGLSKLGPYGMAAAAGVKVFSETINAVKQTIDGLVKRGRELAPYSGTLAASAARADVRKLMSDVGEADRVGPALAKLIDAQSRAEAMQQRLLEPIKAFLAERLTVLLERGLNTGVAILEAVASLPGIGKDFKDLVRDLKAAGADPGDTTALVEKWARGFSGTIPATAPAPKAGPRPAPLGIPFV